jgi:hypothetical protein
LGGRGRAAKRGLVLGFVAVLAVGLLTLFSLPAAGSGKGTRRNSHANSNAQAAENSTKGMNRESGPGEWKENGHQPSQNSAPQGYSPSDPDNGGNGGIDKPGSSGGFDADKDGNNGCGNDTDREDDNNGWCGTKPAPEQGAPPTSGQSPAPAVAPSVSVPARQPAAPSVLGVQLHAPQPAPEVQGLQIGGLPRTGVALLGMLLAAGLFVSGGVVLRKGAGPRS